MVRLVAGPAHRALAGGHHLEMHDGLVRRHGQGRRDLDRIGEKLADVIEVAGRVDQQHAPIGE